MSEPFAYDAVEYPSSGITQMHPSHLFAVARLYGCRPAAVERCRYLEFGCGDGTHLIACAVGLPEATFVGVDLSAEAVARGNRLIAELGVTNVTLHAADVTAWTPPAGEFDYACAHGLYSWVPPFVRDAVMAGIHSALAPHGIGYVSYNTYPGCHLRAMVWEMMRHHTDHVADPALKIREATDLLKFVLAGIPAEGRKPSAAAFAHEIGQLLHEQMPSVMYHDDLSSVNDPVYFHQFAEHAGRHGLRFVAEAEHVMMQTHMCPPVVAGVLNGMAAQEVLLREQHIDYLRVRRFRHTILAKDGRTPHAHPDPSGAAELSASSPLTVEGDASDLRSPAELRFRRDEAAVSTAHPLVKAVLFTIAESGLKRLSFDDLLATAVGRLGQAEPAAEDRERLCGILTEAWTAGLIDLHGTRPRYADGVSERPRACPVARTCARDGKGIVSRSFIRLTAPEASVQRLLMLLDGTRTVDEIAEMWVATRPADEPPLPRSRLDDYLRQMARNGLLVG